MIGEWGFEKRLDSEKEIRILKPVVSFVSSRFWFSAGFPCLGGILNKNVTKFRRRNFDVLQQSLLRIIRWQLRAAPPQRRCWKELQVGTWMHWQSKHSIAWQIFITTSRLETSCKWTQVRGQCRGSANFESGCGVGIVFCVGQRTLINVAT